MILYIAIGGSGVFLISLVGMFFWLWNLSKKVKKFQFLLKDQKSATLKRNRFLGRLDKVLESSAPMLGR